MPIAFDWTCVIDPAPRVSIVEFSSPGLTWFKTLNAWNDLDGVQGRAMMGTLPAVEKQPISMSTKSCPAISIAAAAILALTFLCQAHAQVEYVDPTIGNVGILLVPT